MPEPAAGLTLTPRVRWLSKKKLVASIGRAVQLDPRLTLLTIKR